jgi:peptidoglycan/LPS O-acetylase OafA/YrhL
MNQRIILILNRVVPFAKVASHGYAVRAGFSLLMCSAVVGCAYVSFRWFEEPCRLRIRAWVAHRFPSGARRAAPSISARVDVPTP